MTTQTCYDHDPRVQAIYQAGRGGNGTCWILKIDDHYRVLKRLFNRDGIRISEMFENELKFKYHSLQYSMITHKNILANVLTGF